MSRRQAQVALADATRKALRQGKLTKPDACTRCQTYGKVLACHVRADVLDPDWLCAGCHKAVCPRVEGLREDRSRPAENVLGRHVADRDIKPDNVPQADTLLERAVLAGMKRPRTKDGYLISVKSFQRHAGKTPSGWHGEAVERWRDHLRRTMRPRSVNVRLGGLKYASRRMAAMGWGPDFAAGAEAIPAPIEKTRKAVRMDTAAALVNACDDGTPRGLRDRAILIIGFRCGVRREGIVNLDFADIGPGRRLTIIQKGGGRHEIPAVDDEVIGVLGQWISWLRSQGVKEGPVFRGVVYRKERWRISSRRLCPESVNLIVKTRAAIAGTSEHMHPHLMRHSFVSWQVAAGVPDRRIMAVTGHRDPSILSTYTTDVLADDDPVGNRIPSLTRKK